MVEQRAAPLRETLSAQRRAGALRAGLVAVMAAILLAPAIWNRFPLLEYDTGGYLARWFEGYLVPSRPGAYGLLLAAAAPWEFWPIIVLQAAATIWILALLLRELGLGRRPVLLLGVIGFMSLVTTLPWLTSILLTDIFAGLAVLALHLLVFGRTCGGWQSAALIAFVAFAAATHSATLALVAALAASAGLAALLARGSVAPAGARRAVTAAAVGLALTLSANWAVSGRFAFTPGGYGIVFGRMLQDGIVTRYLDDHCPDRTLELCRYRHALPRNADDFLWGGGLFDQLGRFVGLGDEMRTIVLGSLVEYPWMQVKAALAATAAQLVNVATGEGVINEIWHTYGIMERYTPAVLASMRAARQQRGELGFAALNRVHVPLALLSMALLPLLAAGSWWRPALGGPGRLAATVAIALLANAFLCGTLSNPHDRYGARLVWLAPLTILLVPVSAWASRRSRGGSAREAGARQRRSTAAGPPELAGAADRS